MELLHLMRVQRWGEEAVNGPIDRTAIRVLSTAEFDRLKEIEDAGEVPWRAANGYPSRSSRQVNWNDPER